MFSEFLPATAGALGVTAAGSAEVMHLRHKWMNREQRRASKKLFHLALNAQPPQGADLVRTDSAEGDGEPGPYFVVAVGTPGAALVKKWLAMLKRAGHDGLVGAILVIELDVRRLKGLLEGVDDVYHNRIEIVRCTSLSGGLGNRSREQVMRLAGRWGPPLRKAVQRAIHRYRRLNLGRQPALGLLFTGIGGSWPLGEVALEQVGLTFQTSFYGLVVIPALSRLRRRTKQVLKALRRAGLKGVILSSNAGSEVLNDTGMIAALTVIAAGSDDADAAMEANNIFMHMCPNGWGVLSYVTYADNLPAYRVDPQHPDVPRRWWTPGGAIDEGLATFFEQQDAREDWGSLGGVGWEDVSKGTCTFDLVLAGIVPGALQAHADDLLVAREVMGGDKTDRMLIAASVATPIDEQRPVCPLVVVTLRALAQPDAVLDALGASGDEEEAVDQDDIYNTFHQQRKDEEQAA